ncbi:MULTISPECIES: hypothetical protein [Bacillus cereus group]|uniref:hypothetical protein n=1 Tax=Bacillus cereus group TaxID=86661 RepID=UPI00207A7D45|nr:MULTISPECIES: hypothetical protein [Bacillus cereus group]MED2841244.1 hypothetical protein [Bacillus wiedmannii]USL16386.1 hypothetical protein LIT28_28865 [Bacillus thuringiensis]
MNRIKVPFGRKKKPKLPVEDISALSSMEFDHLLYVLNELANKLTKQHTFSNI